MFPIQCLTRDFEGEPLPFFTYNGQLATVLRQLGRRFGYARDGERLVTNVMEEWASEFQEGKHWVRVEGDDLAALKALDGLPTSGVGSRAPQVVLLLEPGIHLVLLKTQKPIGIRLRAFLAEEVMPALLRTGKYAPEAPATAIHLALVVVPPLDPPASPPDLREARERRLAAQHDLRTRRVQSAELRDTARKVRTAGLISEALWLAFEVAATEIVLGQELPDLRPAVNERWYTVRQIAAIAGVHPGAVGAALRVLGLREAPGLSRQVLGRAAKGAPLAPAWVYNDVALGRVLRVLTGAVVVAS
jgi:hypothetical protein